MDAGQPVDRVRIEPSGATQRRSNLSLKPDGGGLHPSPKARCHMRNLRSAPTARRCTSTNFTKPTNSGMGASAKTAIDVVGKSANHLPVRKRCDGVLRPRPCPRRSPRSRDAHHPFLQSRPDAIAGRQAGGVDQDHRRPRAIILAMNMDGSGETQITRDARHENPVWSPDGRKLAFILIGRARTPVHDDPNRRLSARLTPPTQSAIHPSFTPDGRRSSIAPTTTCARRQE